ncbi:hypothetical protein [Gordonia paraffinivorans]|uniref:hypothetical protein n=1 Tax=Gordonia paraffinivorans TaxID=175628 RepID=UPI00144811ED|nr:hypothetical protein [Gordonia paraffinivorans]
MVSSVPKYDLDLIGLNGSPTGISFDRRTPLQSIPPTVSDTDRRSGELSFRVSGEIHARVDRADSPVWSSGWPWVPWTAGIGDSVHRVVEQRGVGPAVDDVIRLVRRELIGRGKSRISHLLSELFRIALSTPFDASGLATFKRFSVVRMPDTAGCRTDQARQTEVRSASQATDCKPLRSPKKTTIHTDRPTAALTTKAARHVTRTPESEMAITSDG